TTLFRSGLPLLTVLSLPRAGLQAALYVDEGALPEVLAHDLGQVPLPYVPGHAVVVVGELAAIAVRPTAVSVGGDAERGHRLPAGRVPHLGVAGEPPDQHHLVQTHSSSSSASPAAVTWTG